MTGNGRRIAFSGYDPGHSILSFLRNKINFFFEQVSWISNASKTTVRKSVHDFHYKRGFARSAYGTSASFSRNIAGTGSSGVITPGRLCFDSLDYLVFGSRRNNYFNRRNMGFCLAHVNWPRAVLDSAACLGSERRAVGWNRLYICDTGRDAGWRFARAQ